MENRIIRLPGSLATEARLLEELGLLRTEARQAPALLSRPIRILVPSGSLRLHLSARIAQELGCVLGIQIQTLQSIALEVLHASGQKPHRSNTLVELLARRCAARQAALSEALAGFEDGLGSIPGVVRDLFDAGFDAGSGEALMELIDDAPLSLRAHRRARSLLKVAMDVDAELAERKTGGRAALLRQAREAIEDNPELLPCRALFVHGFADVTGSAGDLLKALARHREASFLMDEPRDPAASGEARPDRGVAFNRRLLEPLEGLLGPAHDDTQRELPSPCVSAFTAPGPAAELREVAQRIRVELSAGVRPESIAIVARNAAAYASCMARELGDLGIAFAAQGLRGPIDAAARRIHAFIQLIEEEEQCPIERWFDALGKLAGTGTAAAARPALAWSPQLLLGLRVTGAGRLGDLARVSPGEYLNAKGELPLPLREGLRLGAAQGGDGERFRAPQRRLSGAAFEGALARAEALLAHIAAAPAAAPASQHRAHLEGTLGQLEWSSEEAAQQRVSSALDALCRELGDEELQADEFKLLALRKLAQAAAPPLAATEAGSGVALLDAMEARGRTFERLYLIGLNRDVFPRTIAADPIFPDEVRTRIEAILPDIPVLGRGRLEDRYLFAQLLSASPKITLSWLATDQAGKPKSPSPLVERLLSQQQLSELPRAPRRFPNRPDRAHLEAPRSAAEQAALAGIYGTPDEVASHLAMAQEERAGHAQPELSDFRNRLLRAFEEPRERSLSMAPWLGFLGRQEQLNLRPDPRREAPYVTRIEGMAKCPWQALLTHILRLKAAPDPLDKLPGLSPLVLGNIVHNVLCRIDEAVLGEASVQLPEALARTPQAVDWPLREAFDRILRKEAHAEVKLHSEPIPGLVEMLAECARPLLEAARELRLQELKQHIGQSFGVLAAEVGGRADFEDAEGTPCSVVFKADRVELQGERTVLSDYKTGKPKKESTLKSTFIPQGEQLQTSAYITAALKDSQEVEGRFIYLAAGSASNESMLVPLDGDAKEQLEDFRAAVSTVQKAWLAGSFFPRLTKPDHSEASVACKNCEVREACLQGDSGARQALKGWCMPEMEHPGAATFQELWQLKEQKRAKKTKAQKAGKN